MQYATSQNTTEKKKSVNSLKSKSKKLPLYTLEEGSIVLNQNDVVGQIVPRRGGTWQIRTAEIKCMTINAPETQISL